MGKIFGKNKFNWKPGEYYSSSKGKNAEIGSKYNVRAWEMFGGKKLKGSFGYGIDDEEHEIEATKKKTRRRGIVDTPKTKEWKKVFKQIKKNKKK